MCKGSYYGETLDGEVEMWEIIGGKVSLRWVREGGS